MSDYDAHTAELKRAIAIRTDGIQQLVSDLQGTTSTARVSLHRAFDLLAAFDANVRAFVNRAIASAADPAALKSTLKIVLRHLVLVADFIDKHLAHGDRRELSQALSDEVADELAALDLAHYNVILAHGDAANFLTEHGDIDRYINGPIGYDRPELSEGLRYFALFSIPRMEGRGIYWKPILVGHEVGHVYIEENGVIEQVDLRSKFDFASARTITSPASQADDSPSDMARELYMIATNWLKELVCDFYALYRYGPASVAAIGEYLETIESYDSLSQTHPPILLRIHLLLSALGPVVDTRLRRIIEPWNDIASTVPNFDEDWAQFLVKFFAQQSNDLRDVAADAPTSSYSWTTHVERVHTIADRLADGIVSSETPENNGHHVQKSDVVNAAWLARTEEADTQIDSLACKAVENISFVTLWTKAGGSLPSLEQTSHDEIDNSYLDSVLSEEALINRLAVQESRKRLTMTPLLHLPKGSAVDLRLGCRFIAFRRTRDASFDPLQESTDPRMMQVYQELSWTEQIVLHPQELLLASTLEFLTLPPDLTGQVITRSSYGRLGLLSATAVQVHPNFQGCLTLELVNLSNLPLVLTPGERVAQLVVWRTSAVARANERYHCPVGPEFSKARSDIESEILWKIHLQSS